MEDPVTTLPCSGEVIVIPNGDALEDHFGGAGDHGGIHRGSGKKRIVYDKNFLMECSHSPQSMKKPREFPLPDLGCTLGILKSPKPSTPVSNAPGGVYVPPKRKEKFFDSGGISLRPGGGSFPGTSPVFAPPVPREAFTREDREGEREWDRRDRGTSRISRPDDRRFQGRFGEGEGPEDPFRTFENRANYNSGKNGRGNFIPDRRNFGNGDHREFRPRDNKRREHDNHEKEPEWFSGGPSSRHETMELRGFNDDDRKEQEKSPEVNREGQSPEDESIKEWRGSNAKSTSEFSLDKIWKMESPMNGNEEEEISQPSGTSRFSQIFLRNARTTTSSHTQADEKESQGLLLKLQNAHASATAAAATNSNNPIVSETGTKKTEIKEQMGNALRSFLKISAESEKTGTGDEGKPLSQGPLIPPQEVVLPEVTISTGNNAPKVKAPVLTQTKLPPSGKGLQSTDEIKLQLQMLLMQDRRNKQIDVRPVRLPTLPGSYPGPSRDPRSNGNGLPEFFQVPTRMSFPTQPQQKGNGGYGPAPVEMLPFQVLKNLAKGQETRMPSRQVFPGQPFVPVTPLQEVCTPQQVMGMLPPDTQNLIANVNVDQEFWKQSEHASLLNAVICGQYHFRNIIHDLVSPACVKKQLLASLVQLILSGCIQVPSYTLLGHPISFQSGSGNSYFRQ